MINYLETDIFTSTADMLVCPVNTAGVMGAGLAKQFRIKYPGLLRDYQRAYAVGDVRVGRLWTWRAKDQEKFIMCFPTKSHWREQSRVDDIITGLKTFRRCYPRMSHIAFPKLGCGCGGLSWDIVRLEMERYLGDLPIRVDVHIY